MALIIDNPSDEQLPARHGESKIFDAGTRHQGSDNRREPGCLDREREIAGPAISESE